MNPHVKAWLADLAKWLLVVIFAAVAYYVVCPKYYFIDRHTRGNMITGEMESWHSWAGNGHPKWKSGPY